jgi:hypothetical protein
MTSASNRPEGRLAYSVYDQMRAGNLDYLKIGRRRIITRQQLEAFLTRAS